MMNRVVTSVVGTAVFACSLAWSASVGAQNLISDAGFTKFGYDPAKHQGTWQERWIPHQIKAPSEWQVDSGKKSVQLTGGETFLHSPYFAVKPGQKLKIAVAAEGTGKVTIQCLWWTADGGMADPHRTIPIEPVALKDASQEIAGTATVPEGAEQAYIRIVVQDGTATISKPQVTAAK